MGDGEPNRGPQRDEAAELRAAFAADGLTGIEVPDDWPRLTPPAAGGEPIQTYFRRAILAHPLTEALGGAATVAGGQYPVIRSTMRPAEWTLAEWAAHLPPRVPPPPQPRRVEGVGRRLAGGYAAADYPPADFFEGSERVWGGYQGVPRVTIARPGEARRRAPHYRADRCVKRLVVAFFDAQRAGDLEASGHRMDLAENRKELLPEGAWGNPAYTLDLNADRFAPAGGGLGVPHFHTVRVFRGGLRPGAPRWPDSAAKAAGLALGTAWREMAPPAIIEELRALELQGYPSLFTGLAYPPNLQDERARDLGERLRALLRDELATEARFVVVGIGAEGETRAPGAWFRVPDLALSWEGARVQHAGRVLTTLRVFPVAAAPSAGHTAEAAQGLALADDNPPAGADARSRPKHRGGRPLEFDRLKIGNALRRYVEKDPDGLPETGKERRDLVRRICADLFGKEPADSTLAEIMDDLELR